MQMALLLRHYVVPKFCLVLLYFLCHSFFSKFVFEDILLKRTFFFIFCVLLEYSFPCPTVKGKEVGI